jgi:hypothetical protein
MTCTWLVRFAQCARVPWQAVSCRGAAKQFFGVFGCALHATGRAELQQADAVDGGCCC